MTFHHQDTVLYLFQLQNKQIFIVTLFPLSLLMNMHQFITLKYYFFLNSLCPSAKTSHSAVVVAQINGMTISAEIQLLTGSPMPQY